MHVVRCFENDKITHVEGSIDPIRDAELIETELLLADLQTIEKNIERFEKLVNKEKNADKKLGALVKLKKYCDQGKMASQSVPMPKLTPGIGLVEHDPEDFLRTSIESAERALQATRKTCRDVRGVGIANQGETSIAWSAADGQSIGPAISWEDRRTSNICDGLTKQGIDKLVRERTGVLLDPYFSASKFHWFTQNLRNIQEVIEAGQLRLLSSNWSIATAVMIMTPVTIS